MIWGSGGSKSRFAKAAGAEPAGQMRDVEKVHAVVARSTFPSQNVQNTSVSVHFWKLRCRKSARRCGAKHISKSKCTKHTMVGPLLEVQISKKCTPLWREAHFEVKMFKNTRGSDHFWRFRCRFASLHYTTLHYTTLHYTTLHYTTLHPKTLQLQLHNYTTTLHYTTTTLQLQLHNYTPLHSTTLNYTTLHFTTLHYTTLHSTTLHYTTLPSTTHYTTLQQNTLHYTTTTTTQLHSTTLHYTTLHYTTFHYTPLHYTTLHYTTLHYTE